MIAGLDKGCIRMYTVWSLWIFAD